MLFSQKYRTNQIALNTKFTKCVFTKVCYSLAIIHSHAMLLLRISGNQTAFIVNE